MGSRLGVRQPESSVLPLNVPLDPETFILSCLVCDVIFFGARLGVFPDVTPCCGSDVCCHVYFVC